MLVEEKMCVRCGEIKPASEFKETPDNTSTGLDSWCRDCHKEYKRVRREKDADAQRKARKNRPEHYLALQLKRYYNITVDDFQCMALEQNGVCAICGSPPEDGTRLHVDHNHDSGVVRGLLCLKCNMALGLLGDNYAVVLTAAEYLARADAI